MLRRMDGWVASGFQGIDWDGAAALGRRGLMWFALAGTVFLLGRVQMPPTLAPFAIAFLAAALATGKNAAALLAGCVAAAMGDGWAHFNYRLPAGAAVVLGGGIAWDALSPALERALGRAPWRRIGEGLAQRAGRLPRRQARSPNRRGATVCPTLPKSSLAQTRSMRTKTATGTRMPLAAEARATTWAALERMSSQTSGLYFCGMMEEPVQNSRGMEK